MYRHLIGTISDTTQKNDCWKPTAMPMKTWLTIRVFTSWATAPMMLPMSAMMLPIMKNLVDLSQLAKIRMWCLRRPYHLLPKMSDSWPTMRNTIAPSTIFARGTQLMLGDGPMSALISVKIGAMRP
jgi:hypothetical protein